MQLLNEKAFTPFYDALATVTGVRNESGVVHDVRLTVKCCLIDSGFAEPAPDALASTGDHLFAVLIPHKSWLEATPPKRGDSISINTGYQSPDRSVSVLSLRVASVEPDSSDAWHLTCLTRNS